MSAESSIKSSTTTVSTLLAYVWIGTLLASFLTNVLWKEVVKGDIQTGFYIRIAIALLLIILTYLWQATRSLRRYWLLLLVLNLGDIAAAALQGSPAWAVFWNSSPSWFIGNLGVQLPRLFLSFFAWITLLLMGMKRKDYFMVVGQLDAPNEPIHLCCPVRDQVVEDRYYESLQPIHQQTISRQSAGFVVNGFG